VLLYSFFDLSFKSGRVANAMPWPLFPFERDTVTTVQETGRAPWSVWMDTESLVLTGFPSPDRTAHGELLYQVRYLSPICTKCSSCCTLHYFEAWLV